ncbi:hypothetical protein [Halobacillus sp. B23F22_1]|uniref:hypothetical protein n=1 Tax=Halobacillus sp. B23F22_1 TaxID=3459514 RepID=UPI00373F5F9D
MCGGEAWSIKTGHVRYVAGTARAKDVLGQVISLTKLSEAVPAARIHRKANREAL